MKNLSSGNLWAGAEHWKKIPPVRRRRDGTGVRNGSQSGKRHDVNDEQSKSSKKKKGGSNQSSNSNMPSLISISKPIENLEAMLEKPQRKRAKNAADPIQLTKAMRTKHGNNDNLLPLDAGLGVKEFITLFSRPNMNLIDFVKTKNDEADTTNVGRPAKVVGFYGVETLGTDDASGVGLDFGGGDDGYESDGLDEFVVPALEDVRRVDKIDIGYATVARKIDVKRLKRDLWAELEQTFSREQNVVEEEAQSGAENENSDEISTVSTISGGDLNSPVLKNNNDEKNGDPESQRASDVTTLSFQETVRDMQTHQSQSDVTVPFYFICILHLCNEKGLALESSGLNDFVIHSS